MSDQPDTARALEARRQQALLRALWPQAGAIAEVATSTATVDRSGGTARGVSDGLLCGIGDAGLEAGLAAYRRNASALAERALAAVYPTVAALVGPECFAALAQAHWQRHPPTRGDLAEWGQALPEAIADDLQLAAEPYLADVATLDLAVHRAASAADAAPGAPDLQRLAQDDAQRLCLLLAPGAAIVDSRWPIVEIWQAHQPEREADPDRFDPVRAALDAGRGQCAFVHREGLAVRVIALEAPVARFGAALLRGASLAAALDAGGDAFAFDQWLVRALRRGWLQGVQPVGA